MSGLGATFWISLGLVAYPYAGYVAALWLMSRFTRPLCEQIPTCQDAQLPRVTLIISAYNEDKVIGEKIRNALSLDYPTERLEIVVVSDGSTDRTCEVVWQLAHQGVVLRHYDGRIGKTACLNHAVPLAAGDIVVFSDANSSYEKRALKELVRPFQRSDVGFVTGWTQYSSSGEATADSLGLYSRLELATKELESRLGSCIGADGAIFAIRKELYRPLHDYDINDFVIPLSINERGYRGVLQRKAICLEKDAGGIDGEFRRQVRIASRTIRALMNHRRLFNPFKFGLIAFELLSHKMCRFLVPLFMAALFLSNLFLVARAGFFMMMLIAQVSFYVAAGVASLVPKGTLTARMAELARTVVVMNAAMVLAWVKYLQRETYTTWSPTKR